MSKWFVYIVECVDQTLYTGIATDIERRVNEHNTSKAKAAKYTWPRRPVQLVWQTELRSRSEAAAEEYRIKQMSRLDKQSVINKGSVTSFDCINCEVRSTINSNTDLPLISEAVYTNEG